MLRLLLHLSFVLFLAGCANSRLVIRNCSPPGKRTYERQIFLVAGREFSEIEDFKLFVRSLPRGSSLLWDSGCIGYKTIPLLHSDMSIEQFRQYCTQNGITFRHEFGWRPPPFVSRAYPLRDGGFKSLVELLTRSGSLDDRAKPLFEQCGVPYGENLREFFKECAVPCPDGSSIRYDSENARIIVTAPRDSQEIITHIIWRFYSREFDVKMKHLANSLSKQCLASSPN